MKTLLPFYLVETKKVTKLPGKVHFEDINYIVRAENFKAAVDIVCQKDKDQKNQRTDIINVSSINAHEILGVGR